MDLQISSLKPLHGGGMMRRESISVLLFLSLVNAANAAPPIERINECRKVAMKAITDQTRAYTSSVIEVRARAGVLAGVIPSCSRQEEVGSVAFPPPSGYAFEGMDFHSGPWENATLENANWSPAGTTGTIRVHGHGCDRNDDAVAKGWWTGTTRRVVTPAESEEIWRHCIEKEIPQ